MTPQSVARRYATALFDVALKANSIDKVREDLSGFSELVASQPELRVALESPAVPAQKKRALVEAVLANAGGVSGEVTRLLAMLAERDRLSSVAAIAKAFGDRVNIQQGIVDATIVTAVPLSAERQAAVAKALAAVSGSETKNVRVTATVDPSIIGGVIARVGSVVYDGSVTRQLENMKSRLSADA